jgi:hypothetical protein
MLADVSQCEENMGEFPLHWRSFQRSRQFQLEPLEQDLLIRGGLANAAFANHGSGSRRKFHGALA